jgi:hypothetical protein
MNTLRLLLTVMALSPFGCGGGGGGKGMGGGGGNPNPVPTITSLSPDTANADPSTGGATVAVTVNGTNFVARSTVLWNGSGLAASSYVSPTELTVNIPVTDLAASGVASVTVSNPTPGGGPSNAANFTIAAPTPALAMSGLSPADAGALSGGFVLNVNATNIMQNSVIEWNGNLLTTTFVTAPATTGGVGVLSAVINNSLIASAGAAPVTIMNPNPDGSVGPISAAENFAIGAAGASPACLLAGTLAYAFVLSGTDNNGAVSMVGNALVSNTGAVVNTVSPTYNSFFDFKDSSQLVQQQYIAAPAGSCVDNTTVPNTGNLQFTVKNLPGTFNLQYGLRALGQGGRAVATNTALGLVATGQIVEQSCTPNCGPFGGSFSFGLDGVNGAQSRYAVAGAICGSTNVSFYQADFDDNGTTATATAMGVTWGGADAPSGRTQSSQAMFTTGGSNRPLTLTLYGVNANLAYLMDSTPIATSSQVLSGVASGWSRGGSCFATGQGGSFDNTSATTSVLALRGGNSASATTTIGVLGNLNPAGGGACAMGQGSASLTADFNAAGVAHKFAPLPVCYGVDTHGRGTLAYTDPVTSTASGASFYLDGFGTAYMIGQGNDIPFGVLQPQAVNPTIAGGDYVFGPDGLNGTTLLPITAVVIDTTALTFAAAGGASAGPYALDPITGRGTITLNTAATFGDTQLVFYVLRGRTLMTMDSATATPGLGLLVQ